MFVQPLLYQWNRMTAFIHRHPALESFLHTFWTELVLSEAMASALDHIFTAGDFSSKALYAFTYAVFRTAFHTLREQARKKVVAKI